MDSPPNIFMALATLIPPPRIKMWYRTSELFIGHHLRSGKTLIDTWTKRDGDDGRHNEFHLFAKVLNLVVSCQLSAVSFQ